MYTAKFTPMSFGIINLIIKYYLGARMEERVGGGWVGARTFASSRIKVFHEMHVLMWSTVCMRGAWASFVCDKLTYVYNSIHKQRAREEERAMERKRAKNVWMEDTRSVVNTYRSVVFSTGVCRLLLKIST